MTDYGYGESPFYSLQTSVKQVVIQENITSIGDYAFLNCSELTSIDIPYSVTSIGWEAFNGCVGLTSINIPNSISIIGNYAFRGCLGLTSVNIPNSVTSIGTEAFYMCSGLRSIKVDSGNLKYDSRNNCNAIIETKTNTLIRGCENTIIPNSVTSIEAGAFDGCSGLTSIIIPKSVTSIGSDAFNGCIWLRRIYALPTQPPTCGSGVFEGVGINTLCTLYVPENPATAFVRYSEKAPWNEFNIFYAKSCATPQIAYKNGKLEFTCATEGAKYHYNITSVDITGEADSDEGMVDLLQTYKVSVYATAPDYLQSETATATLYLAKGSLDGPVVVADVNGDGSVNSADVVAVYNSIINGK